MRDWLLGIDPKLVTLMQFASSTLLALAGFVLATVVMYLGYRNNFGWKPSVLILRRWDGANSEEKWAGADFEVWNRQKYPVVLRVVEVDYGDGRVTGPADRKMPDGDKWEKLEGGRLLGRFDEVIEGSKHSMRLVRPALHL